MHAAHERTQRIGAQFVITDLEVALALADRAAAHADAQVTERNVAEARRALEVIDGLMPRLTPTREESELIRERRDALIARLAQLE